MIETLFPFIMASALLAISPGPDNIFVLAESLSHGVKSGIATTAGLVSGCIVHTTLLAFGISAIITASETLFYIIKLLGVGYLLFLSYQVYKHSNQISLHHTAVLEKKSLFKMYKKGVVMNLLNPKVMLFFLAFFPGFLWKQDQTVFQFYILGIIFMVLSFIIFSTIALLAGKISKYINKNKKVGTIFKWVQISVFIGIAIFMFF